MRLGSDGDRRVSVDAIMALRKRMDSFQEDQKQVLEKKLTQLLETAPESEKPFYEQNFKGFQKLYGRFLDERKEELVWNEITPLPEDFILKMSSDIDVAQEKKRDILNKLAVLKLNGGLGTGMGCVGPKSAITVRGGKTFLDMTVEQISAMNREFDVSIPLVLMNSFNTDEDTSNILRKYVADNVDIHSFNQSKFPRINQETLLPFADTVDSRVSFLTAQIYEMLPITAPSFVVKYPIAPNYLKCTVKGSIVRKTQPMLMIVVVTHVHYFCFRKNTNRFF